MSLPNRFQPLPLASLTEAPQLPQSHVQAALHDPAHKLFTDLQNSACVIAQHGDSLPDTLHVMLRAGTRMAFVAGSDGSVIGLVTASDLQGERPVQRALGDRLHHRELRTADVMLPVSHWQTIDMHELRSARVGDVVATLRASGQSYLLVTERLDDGHARLRGLFSLRRIELALGQAIEHDNHSRSFAELESVLAH